jgi:hypothetical protein
MSLYRSSELEARYAALYEKEFCDFDEASYAHLDDRQIDGNRAQQLSCLDLVALMDLEMDNAMQSNVRFKQLNEHLHFAPTRDQTPLLYWLSNQSTSPGLAHMVKDFLSVPISGVGIEQVFSQGRLICHYLRHQLYPKTMKSL